MSPEVRALFDQFVRRGQRMAKSDKPVHRRLVARVAVTLVTVIVVTALMVAVLPMEAKAGSWWDRITQWTGEMFEFISPRNAVEQHPEYEFHTDNSGLQEVYDTVAALGMTDPVVPMWLPDGYVLEEIRQIPMKTKTGVYARFVSGDKYIIYTANIYSMEEGFGYNIDDEGAVEYENAGVTHYIMQNKEKGVAVWTKKTVECSLTIADSKDFMFEVLDSIYTVRR